MFLISVSKLTKQEKLRIELDRVDHWVSKGAQMSDRVSSLVKGFRKEAIVSA